MTPEEIGRQTAARLAAHPDLTTVAEAAKAVDTRALIESAGEHPALDDVMKAAWRADQAMTGRPLCEHGAAEPERQIVTVGCQCCGQPVHVVAPAMSCLNCRPK